MNSWFLPHLKAVYCIIEEIILSEKIMISDKKIRQNEILQKCELTEEKSSKNIVIAFENTLKLHLSAEENRMSISCMVLKIFTF